MCVGMKMLTSKIEIIQSGQNVASNQKSFWKIPEFLQRKSGKAASN